MTLRTRLAVLVVLSTTIVVSAVSAAEVRTWNAANGGYSVQAQFVALKAVDIVQLKTNDGRNIDVPLGQLSAVDQQYVRQQTAVVDPSAASPRLLKAQRTADRCRLPSEAIVVYQVFHDDPQTSAAERQIAMTRITELKDLAIKKQVRLNKKWVAAEEAEAVRKQADELMRQGLELLKLDNEAAFRQKFAAAAALEPEEIRADFLAAVIYTAGRAFEKATPVFQKCLTRDPENVTVMNNLALLAVAQGDWAAAATQWRRALDLQPDQRIVHNVGRYLEQATETSLNIPKAARDSLAFPYAELVASGKFSATDSEIGWLFLLIEASALDIDFRDEDEEQPSDVTPAATEDGPVVGGGTGFVVHPGYVLTNAHVAQNDATFEIQLSDGKLIKATRVAKAEGTDLALLKCEQLSAPPLPLAPTMVPRGTDVMLLGYPEMTSLGASLKATRGSISSIPDAAVNDRYLYDAVTNPGNSGGPVCDDRGNVIAVHYLGINTASRYGGGIPSPKALEFVRSALPDFQPVAPKTEKLDWPAVDAQVSPSTVLIWVRKKNAAATKPIGSDLAELAMCLFCGVQGKVRCSTSGCVKGQLIRGGNRSRCPTCSGNGVVKCGVCAGARIDVRLASVQAAIKKATAANAPDAPAPTTTSTTSTASTNPPLVPANGRQVALLSLIDVNQHVVEGTWKKESGRLIGGGVNSSRVQIPYEPPAEYDVYVIAQLVRPGNGGLIMGLVSGERQFYTTLRENGCGISSGGVIGNKYEETNLDLPLNRSFSVLYQVRRNAIVINFQGKPILDYRDDQSTLRLGPNMTMPNSRQLFIGSGGPDVQWAISQITLTPVVNSGAGGAPAANGGPPKEIVAPNGHRYQFVQEKISWSEAKAKCEAMGGYLACLTTAEEHRLLSNAIPQTELGATRGKYWIGGLVRNGQWQWISGEPFSYSPNRPQADPERPYLRLMSNTDRWLGYEDRPGLIEGFLCEWNK